jgi:uncharacterized membrane protein YeaQ/YmgE (transglycosylase-associated protein family)
MLILLALIFGAVAGTVLHFVLPNRSTRGPVFAPAVATAAAAVIYTGLTWLGFGEDNPWLWVVSLLAPIVVSAAITIPVSAARHAHDLREQARLKIA